MDGKEELNLKVTETKLIDVGSCWRVQSLAWSKRMASPNPNINNQNIYCHVSERHGKGSKVASAPDWRLWIAFEDNSSWPWSACIDPILYQLLLRRRQRIPFGRHDVVMVFR